MNTHLYSVTISNYEIKSLPMVVLFPGQFNEAVFSIRRSYIAPNKKYELYLLGCDSNCCLLLVSSLLGLFFFSEEGVNTFF
jgi:hypothetical protein